VIEDQKASVTLYLKQVCATICHLEYFRH